MFKNVPKGSKTVCSVRKTRFWWLFRVESFVGDSASSRGITRG